MQLNKVSVSHYQDFCAMLELRHKTLVVAATHQPVKHLALGAIDPYVGTYYEQVGNFVIGKGQVFAWLYRSPEAIAKLNSQEYDLVFFPPGRPIGCTTSVLDEAWKPNRRRGHADLLALVDGWEGERDGVPTLLIRRMSTRRAYRRNGLNAHLVRVLQARFPGHQLAFEDLTDEGYQFVLATFPEARHVWTIMSRPRGYRQGATV